MYRQEKKYYQKAFFYALIMAVVLLLPFVILDGGYFVFYGDYNAQQIPFYKTCIRAVQEGNFGWNWQTDLGVNLIGSYSFYTLGSPFFWIAALLPETISHYLMAPLLALKLALASLFAFIYIRRFVRKPDSALIGGILYAFSGFSMYNIFFNHFHEAIVFFPLLLIGLEEMVVNKRRGVFILAVALNAFVNYFFFIGECVFLVIYFIARISCDKRFRISVGDFFCLAFESLVGVALAGALFVPSIFQVLDVPRSGNILLGTNFLFYKDVERYGLILEAMFFPSDVAARNNMFTDANAEWSSVAIYLPLFSMAGVAAFVKSSRKHWAKTLLIVCLVMAFIPGLNASFTMLNASFYTRWFYMPSLIMSLATVYALENMEEYDFRFGIKLCAVVVGLMSVLVLFHPIKYNYETIYGDTIFPKFMYSMDACVYAQIIIAVMFLLFLGLLVRERKKSSPSAFTKSCVAMTVLCSMIMGYYYVGYGRILGPEFGSYDNAVSADIEIDDAGFYRIEAQGEINNANMLWDMSSLKSFTSIIPSSTFELYELLGIERTVNSAPDNDRYALRSLAGVKYFLFHNEYDKQLTENALDALAVYKYYDTQDGYDIYINDYAMPAGYAYDNYVTYTAAKEHDEADKLLCRAVVLTDEQIKRFSDILSPLPEVDSAETSLERFKLDAQARISAGVSEFRITNSGFTAKTGYESDELVVFSVPFDKGWSAFVNGSPTTVEKVNGGFSAVRVPAGSNTVTFRYETPGLRYGIMLSIGGAGLYAFYMLIQYVILRKKPRKYAHLYGMDITDGIKAHGSYISQLSKQISESAEFGRVYRPDVNARELDAIRRSLAESAAKAKKQKKPSAFHLNDGEEAMEILKSLDKKKDE